MPLPHMSVDEILTTLNKTSLPTILVEGTTDAYVYRWIEERLLKSNVYILECGGRHNLISVFERRNEIQNNIDLIFLADRDMWLYESIPQEYTEIIFTKGYSIENDIIEGSLSQLQKLFNECELEKINLMFNEIIPWYAFEVCEYLQRNDFKIGQSIHQIINKQEIKLNSEYRKEIQVTPIYSKIISFIKKNRELHIRGKNVLELFGFILDEPGRKPRYSKNAIIDMMLRFYSEENNNIDCIIKKINRKLKSDTLELIS